MRWWLLSGRVLSRPSVQLLAQSALETSVRESVRTTRRRRSGSGHDAILKRHTAGSPTYGTRIVFNETRSRSNPARRRRRRSDGQRTGHAPGRRNERDQTVRINATQLPSSGSEFVVTTNGTGGNPKWMMRIWGDVGPSGTVNVEVDTPSGTQTVLSLSGTVRPYRRDRRHGAGRAVSRASGRELRRAIRPWRRRRVQHHLRVGRPDQGELLDGRPR